MMEMPMMKPVAIKTKHKSFFVRLWRWMTYVRRWEVAADWRYTLPGSAGQNIVIPKSFIFDGASIPKPLWGLLSPTGLLLIPGLIHDFAYRYDYLWAINQDGEAYKLQQGVGQTYWDKLFKQVGFEVNGMRILDSLAWLALMLGGKAAWKKNRARNEAEIQPACPIAEVSAQATSRAENAAPISG